MIDAEKLKAAADQRAYGEAATPKCSAPLDPLDMLRARLGATCDQQKRIGRAISILERHPEFIEYMELQQLLPQLGIF